MARSDGHGVLRIASKAALGAALAALWAFPAGAAWDGSQAIYLGDSAQADFAAGKAGSEEHRYSFFAPQATKVSGKVTGKGLSPKVDLVDVGLTTVDVGTYGTGAAINKFPVATSEWYGFRVQALNDWTGTYKLQTKAQYPKSFKAPTTFYASTAASPNPATGTNQNPYARATYDFGLVKGATITIALKPGKGSTAAPRIKSLVGPSGPVKASDGTVITFPANVKNLKIAESGNFRLTVEDTTKGLTEANAPIPVVATDTIQVTVSPRWPTAKRTWNLPAMDNPRGQQSEIREMWLTSGHADTSAEAFRHWDAEFPQVVSTSCAKCHSGAGYEDYLGADGSLPNLVEVAPPPTRTVDCEACHNDVATNLTEVTFVSSGKVVSGLGDEARCMVCHQGRESKKSVDAMITAANPADEDTVDSTTSDGDGSISFRNLHYFAAAATLYGREAEVGYQYTGKAYEKKFTHVEAYDACNKCHHEHTLKLRLDACVTCHEIDPANVADPAKYEMAIEDLHEARMAGTVADFDADGQLEGIWFELGGMSDVLYKAIREYAKDVNAAPIGYDAHTYPYFFSDPNENGVLDAGEGGYTKWTARLVKAAFNYQLWQKDPGAFAHNAKYVMELMYDSIADLDAHAFVEVSKANGYTVDLASLVRNDLGHFDTSADAYTDWSDEGGVSSSCARCHSLEGFRFRVKYGIDTTISQPTVAGMPCESCHVTGTEFKDAPERIYVGSVTFPYPSTATSTQISNVSIANNPAAPMDSFVCMTCHQGRQSMLTIDASVASASNQQKIQFPHVHYFPAGATQYSTRAAVAYQWTLIPDSAAAAFPAARKYAAPWVHFNPTAWSNYSSSNPTSGMPAEAQCSFCHMQEGSHKFEAEAGDGCKLCHGNGGIETYRASNGALTSLSIDFDANPATTKLVEEVQAFKDALYAKIQAYAALKGKPKPLFVEHQSPYWFRDSNDDGLPDDINGDGQITSSGDRYPDNDKFMVYAEHDLTMSYRDAGSWAHNPRYTIQYLYDATDYMDDQLWNGSPVNPVNGSLLVRPVTN